MVEPVLNEHVLEHRSLLAILLKAFAVVGLRRCRIVEANNFDFLDLVPTPVKVGSDVESGVWGMTAVRRLENASNGADLRWRWEG